jgi:hypothetical protein
MKESQIRKRKFIKTCSFGSLIGTTIEFFDFLYLCQRRRSGFSPVFPSADSTNWFYLCFIAFLSRPWFSSIGHYGDKVAQNYVGNCFIDDGYFSFHWFLPSYASIGIAVFIINAVAKVLV